jgi:hypothetical protein
MWICVITSLTVIVTTAGGGCRKSRAASPASRVDTSLVYYAKEPVKAPKRIAF